VRELKGAKVGMVRSRKQNCYLIRHVQSKGRALICIGSGQWKIKFQLISILGNLEHLGVAILKSKRVVEFQTGYGK